MGGRRELIEEKRRENVDWLIIASRKEFNDKFECSDESVDQKLELVGHFEMRSNDIETSSESV